jgi:hypothetical protein
MVPEIVKHQFSLGLLVAFSVLALVGPVQAQGGWHTQTFQLEAGWNAIWIDVDPVPSTPEAMLAGLDYERISTFIPGRAPGDRGFWASQLENHPPYVSTLSRIVGKQGYFIKMNAPGMLTVTGRPLNKGISFYSRGANLFGGDFDPGNSPTFAQALSDPNLQGKGVRIFELLDDTDTYAELQMADLMVPGVAYMITVSQDVPDVRPFEVETPQEGLQFGTEGYSQIVTFRVPISQNPRQLQVEFFPSAQPPAGEAPVVGGADFAWLQYREQICKGGANDGQPCLTLSDCPGGLCVKGDWMDFMAGGKTLTIPPGQSLAQLEIRAVRTGREATMNKGAVPGSYQARLAITDLNTKNRTILGVGMEIRPLEGLWFGQARLSQVNSYSATDELSEAAPMTMPLILAIPDPATGEHRLLDRVSVTIRRDGRDLERRFDSLFFTEPVDLVESDPLNGNGTSGLLSGNVVLPSDHPLNPYRHRYNPEHREGYEVSRQIELEFGSASIDPATGLQPLLEDLQGNNQLVGTYRETITGLSLVPIVVQGPFSLTRLAETTDLDN